MQAAVTKKGGQPVVQVDAALLDALHDRSVDDHVATLQRLSAAAPDGHARVGCPGKTHQAMPPFAVDVIEDRIVVTASADPQVLVGDIVVSMNGRPADVQLKAYEALASDDQAARPGGPVPTVLDAIGSATRMRSPT